MNPAYAVLAKKYATAFVNLAGKELDEREIGRLEKLRQFFRDGRELLFFFNLPLIEPSITQKVLDLLCADFSTKVLFKKLMTLVCEKHRALLIPDILQCIVNLYRNRHNRMAFAITSAQKLSDEEKRTVEEFLKTETQKIVDANYDLDPSLIAGLRAQSDTLLWEHSVKRQLRMLKRSLIEQGVQWT